jgi:hypothetical protein
VQSATYGGYNPRTHTWSISALTSGATAVLTVVAQVKAVGRLEAPSVLSATGIDPEKSRLEATAAVTGTKVNNASTWPFFAPASRTVQESQALLAALFAMYANSRR